MAAAAAVRPVAALLRRAALLVGILAVVAGFLGMHIISGAHGMHTQATHSDSIEHSATAERVQAPAPADHHVEHPNHGAAPSILARATAVAATSVTIGSTQVPPSCVCQGSCAEKPAMHLDCTPSPAAASLTAPLPGTTLPATQPWTATGADRAAGYAYVPDSPTPRDLSISRT